MLTNRIVIMIFFPIIQQPYLHKGLVSRCALAGYLVDGLVQLLLHGLIALLQQVVPLQQRLTNPSRQLQVPVPLANHNTGHRLRGGQRLKRRQLEVKYTKDIFGRNKPKNMKWLFDNN